MPALFLLNSLTIGGSERKIVRLANALHRRGHHIHLAWLNGPETLRPEIAEGVPMVHLERRGKFSWAALRRLEHYARSHGINRLICVNQYPLLYAKALRLLMHGDAPACIVLINTTEFASTRETRQMALYAPLLRRTYKIVFGCDFQRDLWMKRYRLPERLCFRIYNGVDSDYFSMAALASTVVHHRAAFGLGMEDYVLGTVGALRPEKQQGDLIEAVARLHARGVRAVAVIVGGGEKEAALKQHAERAGIADCIHFLGDQQDVRPALAAMNVFVLTSVAVETFSNAALEAMAMGRSVVLSDVGGAREMVWPGINGYIYPPGDVGRLVDLLEGLSAVAPTARNMGEEARRIAVEKFSFSHMVDEYERLCFEYS